MSHSANSLDSAEQLVVDIVPTDVLPAVPHHIPYKDLTEITNWTHNQPSAWDHLKLAPKPQLTCPEEQLINFELLSSFARFEAAHKFSKVIRMGGSFNHLKEGNSPEDVENIAVGSMGLDASLYYHGAEQARRAERLALMNQSAHRKMWLALVNTYGTDRRAARAYAAFSRQVPNFTARQLEAYKLCGGMHDYGEASIEHDQVFDRKGHDYEEMEAAECVRYAMQLHTPVAVSGLMKLLDKRVEARRDYRVKLTPEEQAEVSFYLHPREIAHTTYRTERSEAFKKATEPVEYVLSGIRAFEAVEHNLGDVRSDPLLAANLLRLGVGTFYNHLSGVMGMAEHYLADYDFLRQNEDMVTRYLDILVSDIVSGSAYDSGATYGVSSARDVFGLDPFTNYEQGKETVTALEAKERILRVAGQWKRWRTKTHILRTLWENYYGTTHRFTADMPDVSFLQYTARHTQARQGKALVLKPLTDMFGVGLGRLSRAQHESLILQETGIV